MPSHERPAAPRPEVVPARYLLGSPRLVYQFAWQGPQLLRVYADADWAGCPATCRSTSGGCALR
eukprot:6009802-Alexandrium_andersonii.AAC.1